MPSINTLAELKKHPAYQALALSQAQSDKKDSSILKSPFTRSLNHIIQFLVIYAGLDEQQKIQTLKQLFAPNHLFFDKAELDELVNNTINWSSILIPQSQNTVELDLTIELSNPSLFLDAMQEHCSNLHQVLRQSNCVLQLKKNNEVVVTTKVSQKELWKSPFYRKAGSDFWEAREFKFSRLLSEKIKEMQEGDQRTFGAFQVKKGIGSLADTNKLYILAPSESNEKSVSDKINVNAGIYNAFVGLVNFYGLEEVTAVKVKLESSATFSDKGAYASQTQVTTLIPQSMEINRNPGKPTVITVNDVSVFFKGLDCVVSFDKKFKASDASGICQIELPTQGTDNTGIFLLSHTPDPYTAANLCQPDVTDVKPDRNSFFGKGKAKPQGPQREERPHCSLM